MKHIINAHCCKCSDVLIKPIQICSLELLTIPWTAWPLAAKSKHVATLFLNGSGCYKSVLEGCKVIAMQLLGCLSGCSAVAMKLLGCFSRVVLACRFWAVPKGYKDIALHLIRYSGRCSEWFSANFSTLLSWHYRCVIGFTLVVAIVGYSPAQFRSAQAHISMIFSFPDMPCLSKHHKTNSNTISIVLCTA